MYLWYFFLWLWIFSSNINLFQENIALKRKLCQTSMKIKKMTKRLKYYASRKCKRWKYNGQKEGKMMKLLHQKQQKNVVWSAFCAKKCVPLHVLKTSYQRRYVKTSLWRWYDVVWTACTCWCVLVFFSISVISMAQASHHSNRQLFFAGGLMLAVLSIYGVLTNTRVELSKVDDSQVGFPYCFLMYGVAFLAKTVAVVLLVKENCVLKS